jgi:hypothetical protein
MAGRATDDMPNRRRPARGCRPAAPARRHAAAGRGIPPQLVTANFLDTRGEAEQFDPNQAGRTLVFGRLVRVRTHRGDPESTLYIVAEPEAERAIDILKVALARSYHEYEDLGRVTVALLNALSLQPGTFIRT